MAKTLPSLSLVTQEALPALIASVPYLSAFSTNFSDEIVQQGTAVVTRIGVNQTPTAFSSVTGYVGQDLAPTSVTINVNQHYYNQNSFTDAEFSSLGIERLVNTVVNPLIRGLVKKVGDDIYGLMTSGNFSSVAYTGTGYNFQNLVASPMATLITAGVGEDK